MLFAVLPPERPAAATPGCHPESTTLAKLSTTHVESDFMWKTDGIYFFFLGRLEIWCSAGWVPGAREPVVHHIYIHKGSRRTAMDQRVGRNVDVGCAVGSTPIFQCPGLHHHSYPHTLMGEFRYPSLWVLSHIFSAGTGFPYDSQCNFHGRFLKFHPSQKVKFERLTENLGAEEPEEQIVPFSRTTNSLVPVVLPGCT